PSFDGRSDRARQTSVDRSGTRRPVPERPAERGRRHGAEQCHFRQKWLLNVAVCRSIVMANSSTEAKWTYKVDLSIQREVNGEHSSSCVLPRPHRPLLGGPGRSPD